MFKLASFRRFFNHNVILRQSRRILRRFKILRYAQDDAAQAAVELAVFGAVLIYIIGTIIRSAVGNSYAENQNFKAMRMAMLASWRDSENGITAHNSASIIFVEDRLSPDSNKYGSLDRSPFIAQGSGTFSYRLLYPLDPSEVNSNLPTMDIYINGVHLPLTTASFVSGRRISPPGMNGVPACTVATPYLTPLTPAQCQANQCLRNQREWVGSSAMDSESQFTAILPAITTIPQASITATACLNHNTYLTPEAQSLCQSSYNNAYTIFNALYENNVVFPTFSGANATCPNGLHDLNCRGSINLANWNQFYSWFELNYPGPQMSNQAAAILSKLQSYKYQYKLFYSMAVNLGTAASTQTAPMYYSTGAPVCASHPCKDTELSQDLVLAGHSNSKGDLMFDLDRLGDYTSADPHFVLPSCNGICNAQNNCSGTGSCLSMRPYMAWQWSATAGTDATSIGLDTTNDQYPGYDIDGRLKEVTIYAISQNSDGTPTVSYEDFQGGDIDSTWDTNSCGVQPGLQGDAQIFTFTKNGTYLLMNEGKMYDPETGQVVRSANKRDSIDLIQRIIQLSNNTGRFCTIECADRSTCGSGGTGLCSDKRTRCTHTSVLATVGNDGVTKNPVEVCVDESTPASNCFTTANIAQTCDDINANRIFVRSRLEDFRGGFWMTNASGKLKVQK